MNRGNSVRSARLSPRQALLLAISGLVLASLACSAIVGERSEPPTVNLIFTAPEAVVALAADKEENVYAVTIKGDVLKITPDGKSKQLYSGLEQCSFSERALTILPEGDLIVNDCVDHKDTLIRIDQEGNKTTLAQLEDVLISMTSDASGKVYLGFWVSEGDITISDGYLQWANNMWGRVSALGEKGRLDNLYEGGLPLSITASEGGDLYAAIWGQKGLFKPQAKEYTMCGPTKHFWIGLSDQAKIQQFILDQKNLTAKSETNGIFSHLAIGKKGPLFAFGMVKGGECGIYQIKPGQDPQRLSLTKDDVDKNITNLAVSDNNLYFSDADGKVYQIGLKNLGAAGAASQLVVKPSATPTPQQQLLAQTAAVPSTSAPSPTPALPQATPTSTAQASSESPTNTPSAATLPPGNWQPLPDLPRAINALVVDPANLQVLYAGTGSTGAGSGVYKSEDAGLTWRSVSAGLPSEDVTALAFSRNNPSVLYAAVGNNFFASADGGASWSQQAQGVGNYRGFEQLSVTPGDGKVLYGLAVIEGAFRSDDGGHNWTAINNGLPKDSNGSFNVQSLAIDPTDPNVVYVGTGWEPSNGNGVYKSTDGGATWTPTNQGMVDYSVTALTVDPAQPQTVYAGTFDGALFRSTNGGQTWEDLTSRLPAPENVRSALRHILIEPATPEKIYLLGERTGVLVSNDGGETWRLLGKPGQLDYPTFTALTVVFDPQPALIAGISGEGGWRYAANQSSQAASSTTGPVQVAAQPTPTVPAKQMSLSENLAATATPLPTPTLATQPTSTPTPLPTHATPRPTPTPAPLPASCPDPRAVITSPANGAVIQGIVPFMGTANLDGLVYYKFEYKPADAPTWQFLTQFDHQSVTNGKLMDFHTSTIAPGVYDFRLIVVDQTGNYPPPCEARVTVQR